MSKSGSIFFSVAKLAVWTASILLFFRFLGLLIGGDFQKLWVVVAGASTLFIVFMADLLKRFRLSDDTERSGSVSPASSADANEANALCFSGESHAMSNNPKVIIQSPGNVTINNNTTHNNVQGGIIGSGSVTVHQHFDKSDVSPPPPATQQDEPVKLLPIKKTANIDELLAYAETLLGRPMAENTVRKILDRAEIESCGEEKRGRARAKTYPREQAEKAIADYVVSNKER